MGETLFLSVINAIPMTMDVLRKIVTILFYIDLIVAHTLGNPENVDFTKCGKYNFPLFINGFEDLVESSDPLMVDLITGNVLDFNYQLNHAKLTGMKECSVTELLINKTKFTFQYNLQCPHLEGNAQYNVTGHVASSLLEGEGELKFTCEDCLIMLDGSYEKNTGKDNNHHVRVQSYNVVLNVKGEFTTDVTNPFGDDKEKTDAIYNFLSEKGKLVNENVSSEIQKGYMDVFIKHLNKFLQLVPLEKGCVE